VCISVADLIVGLAFHHLRAEEGGSALDLLEKINLNCICIVLFEISCEPQYKISEQW